jgi:hypothetical protein
MACGVKGVDGAALGARRLQHVPMRREMGVAMDRAAPAAPVATWAGGGGKGAAGAARSIVSWWINTTLSPTPKTSVILTPSHP